MRISGNGFTLIEFLVIVTIIIIFMVAPFQGCVLSKYIKAKEKAKEAEVKSACHTIQIALERYATDHSGKYPNQIYGGDERGWSPEWVDGKPYGCMAVGIASQKGPEQQTPKDPLIYFGYMMSYPDNAFGEPGKGRTTIISWTGGCDDLGYGDPRFGYNGETMGNCLNDPKYLWEEPNVLSNEQYMIYDWAGTKENSICMVNPEAPKNPFYSMGGLPKGYDKSSGQSDVKPDRTTSTFWPGQFFYRSGGDFFFIKGAGSYEADYEYIWDIPYARITRYILCGYGSPRTEGIDLIRLTTKDGQAANNISGYISDVYETHGDFQDDAGNPLWEVYLSTPEVFGGGSFGVCPTFPYWVSYGRYWQYGAPDGFKDGVIITLISGSDSHKFD